SVVVDPAPPAAQHVMPVLGQALHAGATDRDRYSLGVARNVQENGRHRYASGCDNSRRSVGTLAAVRIGCDKDSAQDYLYAKFLQSATIIFAIGYYNLNGRT